MPPPLTLFGPWLARISVCDMIFDHTAHACSSGSLPFRFWSAWKVVGAGASVVADHCAVVLEFGPEHVRAGVRLHVGWFDPAGRDADRDAKRDCAGIGRPTVAVDRETILGRLRPCIWRQLICAGARYE